MEKENISTTLEPLIPFIGTWQVEGANLPSAPNAPNTPLIGTQAVNLMEGGHFLEARWEYESGADSVFCGLSIIGQPEDSDRIECHNFDNLGSLRVYSSNMKDNLWTLTGQSERATIEFDESGKTYREFWEIKTDGDWQPLCRRTGTRV